VGAQSEARAIGAPGEARAPGLDSIGTVLKWRTTSFMDEASLLAFAATSRANREIGNAVERVLKITLTPETINPPNVISFLGRQPSRTISLNFVRNGGAAYEKLVYLLLKQISEKPEIANRVTSLNISFIFFYK
jgi:hypothetical protein